MEEKNEILNLIERINNKIEKIIDETRRFIEFNDINQDEFQAEDRADDRR